jgi:hypothetical protein
MNLFFVIDEESDLADEQLARYQADCIMDALHNPYKPRPPGEWVGGRITQEYDRFPSLSSTSVGKSNH